MADFCDGLEDLRQSGSVSVQELADLRAKVAGGVEHVGQWTRGTRDTGVEKDMRHAITTCPDDAAFLTRLFDRAVTVTSADERH
ncbi:hypothetical protein ABZV75_30155 [Streptomyces flaveolus]|uniref:hypothetical protein n=1 Tax=Streptomyces flaveolus TaxID=67297 RepID=UPI0033BE53FB